MPARISHPHASFFAPRRRLHRLPVHRPVEAARAEADAATRIELRQLTWGAPLRWLWLGLQDFLNFPAIGLFYGTCFMAMGWALMSVFEHAPAYTLALSAGFLLMGPFLCLGLYQTSRELECGEPPNFARSLLAWRSRTGALAIFGFVLLVLEMLWGRASLIVFAVSFDGMPDFKGSLLALLDPENISFIVAYLVVAMVFGSLIFATTAVSMPMILDRQTDAITAGLTSFRLVLSQPGVLFFWAGLLALLVLAAMLPAFIGLLLVGPVLGHASWHAYRDAVGGSPLDENDDGNEATLG